MIKTFVKNPVKVQAVQWTGDNYDEILNFTHGNVFQYDEITVIKTNTGYRYIEKGDWIIRGVNGQFSPCKPDIFEKTYEEVE